MPTSEQHLTPERRKAFEESLNVNQIREVKGKDLTTFRYVPYASEFDKGTTQQKAIEIIYNHDELNQTLLHFKRVFLIQLLSVVVVSILLSYLIVKWVSTPMHLAFHDELTGLRNRAAFADYNRKGNVSKNEMTAFIMMDLDNFKQVNDYLGHDEGDRMLREVARIINENLTAKDQAFRFGGDEFLIVVIDTNRSGAHEVADKIAHDVQRLIAENQAWANLHISASLGLSFAPDDGTNVEQLCKKADIAMYQSKYATKHQV
ncbi:Diguanylate cyclase [Lentibacillus sp. JNUCC-1]|uniref:GGDEF domain-containing protein n=1 Tax=Lentibacillus sp. JNUCC-1 TaxID=2654513 RepID=UPI0012E825F8|nr:GGDEF domain-containing protein [Lentibacillus sp. JNUCC-1]MUV38319.1 Diguanylate cyclase [Lentibacillus sp. JNUCC-1]